MFDPEKNRIAKLRKSKNLSQQQLADMIDAHWVTISKLERGKIKLTYEWSKKIADALGVGTYEIFDRKSEYDQLRLDGKVVSAGSVLMLDELSDYTAIRLGDEFLNIKGSTWLMVETTDLYPLVRRGDLLRITPIEPHEVTDCEGRLVLAQSEHVRHEFRVGLLGPQNAEGRRGLLKLNGSSVDMNPLYVVGCATMAVFSPLRLGAMRLAPSGDDSTDF